MSTEFPNSGQVTLMQPNTRHLRAYRVWIQFFQDPATDLFFTQDKKPKPSQ